MKSIGLPFIVRPAFTLGGTGGGSCGAKPSSSGWSAPGLSASPIGQILLEESVLGGASSSSRYARPRRQRRDRLLDREHRSDGRAHRRQRVRRAPADPDR